MRKVTVQAYEDRSRGEGGHAVILLHGLARPDGPIAFRVRPLDGPRAPDGIGGWIGGDHRPIATVKTDQGLELVAGPGLTESEHLLPGTVVEIEVPACGARGEFLWPNVAPLMRPKRKNFVANKPRHQARTEQASPPQPLVSDKPPQSAAVPTPALEAMAPPTPVEAVSAVSETSASATSDPKEQAKSTPAELVPSEIPVVPAAETGEADTAAVTAPIEAAPDEATMPQKKPIAAPDAAPAGPHGEAHVTPEEIANKYSWAFRKDVSVMLSKKFFALGDSRHDDTQEDAVSEANASAHHSIAAEATAILAHQDETLQASTASTQPAIEQELSHPMHEDTHAQTGGETFYRHARGSVVAPTHHHAPRAGSEKRKPISAGLAAGLATLAIGGIAGVALLSGQPSVGAGEQSSKIAAIVQPAAAARASEAATADTLLFEALAVGSTSPKGVDASGIGASKALENANVQLLATGPSRDTDEGAFWLKQYIATTLGDERTVRVLTQLGSVYAEPTGRSPDYTKARLLWEISSAAGDPVAMCFLGLLHESGLGVAASKRSALQWYERSKEKGGCPSIDESLARVRQ